MLFNLGINNLTNTINSKRVECKGYVYNGALITEALVPAHGWYSDCYRIYLEKSFTYLGKDFNFSKRCDEIKTETNYELLKYILTIDKLPLKNPCKINIVQRYAFSKLKWGFSIYKISPTNLLNNFPRVTECPSA